METYYTSNFKTYKKASGFTLKMDTNIALLELPSYSTNAVAAVQRTIDLGNDYIYRSTDNGENFTKHRLDGLSADLINVDKLLFSTEEGAYIAYGKNSRIGLIGKACKH